jgi:hypothetical protein
MEEVEREATSQILGRRLKMTTINLKNENRGRPVEPEVQMQRLTEEAMKVRNLTATLEANKLFYVSDIVAAEKLLNRMSKHLQKALRARQLLNECRTS